MTMANGETDLHLILARFPNVNITFREIAAPPKHFLALFIMQLSLTVFFFLLLILMHSWVCQSVSSFCSMTRFTWVNGGTTMSSNVRSILAATSRAPRSVLPSGRVVSWALRASMVTLSMEVNMLLRKASLSRTSSSSSRSPRATSELEQKLSACRKKWIRFNALFCNHVANKTGKFWKGLL